MHILSRARDVTHSSTAYYRLTNVKPTEGATWREHSGGRDGSGYRGYRSPTMKNVAGTHRKQHRLFLGNGMAVCYVVARRRMQHVLPRMNSRYSGSTACATRERIV